MLERNSEGFFRIERYTARQHLIKEDADRVQIRAFINRMGALDLFRAHVQRTADR